MFLLPLNVRVEKLKTVAEQTKGTMIGKCLNSVFVSIEHNCECQ